MSQTTIRVEPKERRDYSDEEKREAVVLFFLHGTQSAVAKALDIPQRTISDWMKTEWWADYHRQMVSGNRDEFGAVFRRIVKKSASELEDRLDKGDLVLGRDGKKRRKPISAKDLTVIMAIATDKDRILRGEPTSISAKATDLGSAAKEFERIAQAPTSAPEPHKPDPTHSPPDPTKRH